MKFSFHFFDNFEEIYNDISKALKPDGKIFVLSLSPETKLPWNDNIEKGFIKSCKNFYKKFFNHDSDEKIVENKKNVKTQIFKNFLQGRGFSNLLQHNE